MIYKVIFGLKTIEVGGVRREKAETKKYNNRNWILSAIIF
jgi:hypothetical protein